MSHIWCTSASVSGLGSSQAGCGVRTPPLLTYRGASSMSIQHQLSDAENVFVCGFGCLRAFKEPLHR